MRDLFFLPDRWEPDPMISTNHTSLIKAKNYNGKTADAWQLGDWSSGWTAITSSVRMEQGWLEPGGEYRFCFCLNGGENSRADEVCMLEIFGDDWEDRLTFPLNRSRTKPLLEKNHWLIFAVPFKAPEAASALHFRFVAAGAVCTVAGIPEMDMSVCERMTPDEPDTSHIQRHNLYFPDGWPEEQDTAASGAHSKKRTLARKILPLTAAVAGVTVGSLLICHLLKQRRASK